jgi:hypothetical protein|tara:strand:- start:211 stop:447 length:237 start_codon:yes stop_codon:yes gene_type:complete
MNSNEIPIIVDNQVSKIFVRANNFIISKNIEILETSTQHHTSLAKIWKDAFNATMDIDNNKVVFDKNKDKTLFLLRWN